MKKIETEKEPKEKRPLLSYMAFVLLFLGMVYIYARYIGTTGIKLREYNIKSVNLPKSFDGFSIVQFSDLELGSTFMLEDLEKLVDKINSLNPDIVVFTGDITSENFNLNIKTEEKITELFKKIDPLLGKYSVPGDDDKHGSFYKEIIDASGFRDLTNAYDLVYYKGLVPIVFYGLDSLTKGNQDLDKAFSYPDELVDQNYMATYRILLAHEPDTAALVGDYNISLMLSGHSHNNEINIPYLKDLYNIEGSSQYNDEKYNINGMQLFISSGLGTSKLHMRLFARPSISIFRLYCENE